MTVVLACDLGGSSFRAALVDVEGTMRAETAIIGPPVSDQLDRSEVDPAAWWNLFLQSCRQLLELAPEWFDRIEAIAICGITRTQVFLGRDGMPLRAAMTWKDARSQGVLDHLPARHPERPNVNAFHPVARLAWLSREEPATFTALATVLEPKDYLNYRLTGRKAGDHVSMARLIASAVPGPGGPDLLTAIGSSGSIVPQALEPTDRVGHVLSGLPEPLFRLEGIPVFCCSNDTWTCVAGLGALRPGFAYNISGTTEVFGVLSASPAYAEGLMTVDWRGVHQLGGPSQTGADTVAWLLGLLGDADVAVNAAIDRLLAGPRHRQPLVFLPFLQGERVPYWDASLRGAFVGLSRQHSPADLGFAVLEGIACLNRVVLERAEAALATAVTEIRFGGGAARNPVWRQIKADICNRPVVVGAAREPGVLGAAMVAWSGLGRFGSLAAAQDALVKIVARVEPNAARRTVSDELFGIYRRAEAALAPVSHDLVSLGGKDC